MRKLASIQLVVGVRPIEGADKIEAVDVLGWTVVCKKDEFKVGDLVVYFEIDSWLDASNPAFATFEERFTNWGTKRGMRLKTIKLRKQISQGLVLAISDFVELSPSVRGSAVQEGDDVTEELKIEKWEPAEETHGNNGGINKPAGAKPFPSFLRKTDEERVQNYITELPKHADDTFEVTIKRDGSSMTVFIVNKNSPHFAHALDDIETRALRKKSKFQKLVFKLKKKLGFVKAPEFISGVCSRNMQVDIDGDNHFAQYAREHGLLEGLDKFSDLLHMSVAVQGELIAPSIQQNYEKVSGFEFHAFNVFNIDTQEYMLPVAARAACEIAGINYITVLEKRACLADFGYVPGCDMRQVVENILTYAEGPGVNPGVKREGVVFKSNNDKTFSFKAISNSYLLAKEKKAG